MVEAMFMPRLGLGNTNHQIKILDWDVISGGNFLGRNSNSDFQQHEHHQTRCDRQKRAGSPHARSLASVQYRCHLEFAAIGDDHLLATPATLAADGLDGLDHVQALHLPTIPQCVEIEFSSARWRTALVLYGRHEKWQMPIQEG
eukprot:1189246-Prorocentrum_minimum.AAC.5